MKLRNKLFVTVSVLALAVTSFTGCTAKSSDTSGSATTGTTDNATGSTDTTASTAQSTAAPTKVSLKVWGPQEDQSAIEGKSEYSEGILKAMCDKFATLHPEWDITFEYGVVSEADARTELNKDAAAGADVFLFASDQTAELVKNGILAPMTLYADEIKSENPEAAIKAATVDDLLYAAPFTPNTWFLYYDKSKFSENDVKSLETMMAKDLGNGVSNFSIDLDNGWYNAAFFLAAGCTLFGTDGQDPTNCTFNDANGLAVGNYLSDLATNKKFLMFSDGNAITAFADGKLGAYCSGTWDASAIQQALGDNYAATKLPTININGKDAQLSSFSDYKYIGVNANTQYPEAAQALAAYLGGEECQKIRFQTRNIAPTNVNLLKDPEVSVNQAVMALNQQVQFATLQSTISQMSNFWTPAEAFGAGVYSGEINKGNMQASLDSLVQSILTTVSSK